MKNLNEQLAKIKGMMKMIQENDYTPTGDASYWEAHSVAMHILADFTSSGAPYYFEDYSVDLNEGSFSITDEDGNELYYEFDVYIDSHGSFSPGTYEDPPESEPTEFHFDNMKLTVKDWTGAEEKVLYSGKDFTNFL